METNAVSQSAAVSQRTAATAASTLTADFNAFLTLLTAQVTNQDPLAPLDSTQFVEQLASFSGLEQQVVGNGHLETIAELLRTTATSHSADILGKSAKAQSIAVEGAFAPIAVSAIGVTDGALSVVDAAGNEVFRSVPASSWSWDGRGANGQPAPAGEYTFRILTNEGVVPGFAIGTVERVVETAGGTAIGFGPGVLSTDFTIG